MPSGKPTIRYDKRKEVFYKVADPRITFKKRHGSRKEVWRGHAYSTESGLQKHHLKTNEKTGAIVSRARSNWAKKSSNLNAHTDKINYLDTEDNEDAHEDVQSSMSTIENSAIENPPTIENPRKKFVFKKNGRVIKECLLEQGECRHNGCTIKTDYPIEYCKQHLQTDMSLCVKPSTLQGNVGDGLFACNGEPVEKNWRKNRIVFHKDRLICEYKGEELTEEEKERMEEKDEEYGPYLLKLDNSNIIIDSACLRGVGSFINHKPFTNANTRFSGSQIYAKKDIRNGSELFISYGYGPKKTYLKKGYTVETVLASASEYIT